MLLVSLRLVVIQVLKAYELHLDLGAPCILLDLGGNAIPFCFYNSYVRTLQRGSQGVVPFLTRLAPLVKEVEQWVLY